MQNFLIQRPALCQLYCKFIFIPIKYFSIIEDISFGLKKRPSLLATSCTFFTAQPNRSTSSLPYSSNISLTTYFVIYIYSLVHLKK